MVLKSKRFHDHQYLTLSIKVMHEVIGNNLLDISIWDLNMGRCGAATAIKTPVTFLTSRSIR
jgi:hypothetical protein